MAAARKSRKAKVVKKARPAEKPKTLLAGRHAFADAARLLWQGKSFFLRLVLANIALVLLLALDAGSEATAIYSLLLTIIFSLAEIWGLRQITAGEGTSFPAALYEGTQQFLSFTLTVLLWALQLVPFAAGFWLLDTVIRGGVAVNFMERTIFVVIFGVLALLSWYWISVSSVAIYISTLPGIRPLEAWHSAKRLVSGRRLSLLGRLLLLIVVLAPIGYLILLPMPETWLVNYNVAAVVVAILLPLMHGYMYKLYRSLV